jgi:hypothetical protein
MHLKGLVVVKTKYKGRRNMLLANTRNGRHMEMSVYYQIKLPMKRRMGRGTTTVGTMRIRVPW